MFKYQDGSEILIGDSVLLENGKSSGVVDLIINTEDEVKAFKVDEIGIMLKSVSFGLVYLSNDWLKEDPLRLVSRAKPNPLFKRDT